MHDGKINSAQWSKDSFQTFPGESEWHSAYQTENKDYRFKEGNDVAQESFIKMEVFIKERDGDSIVINNVPKSFHTFFCTNTASHINFLFI